MKAMRALARHNINWIDKDKDILKDLEDFAKEMSEQDGLKIKSEKVSQENNKQSSHLVS